MNEKIQQLVKQANREIGEQVGQSGVYLDFGPAKYFAELIVKECCQVVKNIPIDETEPHSSILAKHFGVEE